MLEVEIKSYCEDIDKTIDKIISKGGRFVHSLKQDDIYFSHPVRDFNKTDEAFRIRRVNDKVQITYKGPRLGGQSKTRTEEEVEVGDFESIKKIIESLGFVEFGSVSKNRELYQLGDIEICIDSIAGLNDFIELEKKDTHREDAEKELFKLAEELGLNRFETRTYLELLEDNAAGKSIES